MSSGKKNLEKKNRKESEIKQTKNLVKPPLFASVQRLVWSPSLFQDIINLAKNLESLFHRLACLLDYVGARDMIKTPETELQLAGIIV